MELLAVGGITFLFLFSHASSLIKWQAAKAIQSLGPFFAFQIGKADRVACVNHHVVANIDAYMGDALDIRAHRFLEKYEITGTRVLLADIAAQGVEPIGAHPPYIAHAGVVKDPANIAGAVKTGIGIAGTVHIGKADVLLRLNHQGKEIRIGPQKLLGGWCS